MKNSIKIIQGVLSRVFRNIYNAIKKGIVFTITKLILRPINKLLLFIVKIIYLLLVKVYDYLQKKVKKINKTFKISLFYTIIILSVLCLLGVDLDINLNKYINNNTSIKEEVKEESEEVVEVESVVKEESNKESQPVEVQKCDMDSISCKIKEASNKYGVDYKLAIAISKSECGPSYSSNAAKVLNNFGGNMKNGKLRSFASQDEGIDYLVYNLKVTYIDKGLTTPEQIQTIYAPVGAANDKNNLNSNWLKNVKEYYKGVE